MHKKLRQTKKRLAVARRQKVRQVKLLSRHPVAVPIATFFVLITVTVGAFLLFGRNHPVATDAKIVIISHDHVEQTVPTREATVGALLQKLNIPVRDGDVVEPAKTAPINQDGFRINIYRAVPVEIVDGANKIYTFSAATTPRSIARQTGVNVYAEDNLDTLPTTNFLKEGAIGERVVIDRAVPIHVNLYGTQVDMRTHAKTVDGLVKERGIKLAAGDSVEPAGNTPITPEGQVFILRKGTKIESATEDIAMPVQTVYDASLSFGTNAIRQQGSVGKRVVTYQVDTRNGAEVGRKVIQSVVVQQPVTQIMVQGTNLGGIKGDMALAGISPSDFNYADFVISHESHWNPAALNGSGCAGLGQACPGSKLAAVCPSWQTDPVCQLRFFSGYASRYGGWHGAYVFWSGHGYW